MAEQHGAAIATAVEPQTADGVYVYSIVESADPRTFGKIGIGGRGDDVYAVRFRELAAVLSRTPLIVSRSRSCRASSP